MKFKDGQELKSIEFENGERIVKGSNGIEKIIVVMENGQYSLIAWFAVFKEGVMVSKWNNAFCSGVIL